MGEPVGDDLERGTPAEGPPRLVVLVLRPSPDPEMYALFLGVLFICLVISFSVIGLGPP